jgi:hypothetical protein
LGEFWCGFEVISPFDEVDIQHGEFATARAHFSSLELLFYVGDSSFGYPSLRLLCGRLLLLISIVCKLLYANLEIVLALNTYII